MKKLLFAIILSFILVSCNNTENPTTNNTGSTDGTGTENISNSGTVEQNIQENNSGTVENTDSGAVSLSSDLKKIFDEVNSIMGTSDSDIQKTAFDWGIFNSGEGGERVDINGYSILKDKISYDEISEIGEKLDDYFSTWSFDNYNVGDGLLGNFVGYYSGTLRCLHLAGITNPSVDPFEATEEDFKKFDYYTKITCGEVESKKLDKLDSEVVFSAFGMEPFWGYELKGDEIKLDTIYEVEIPAIKVTFEKILNNYYFTGEGISGKIVNEFCVDDGAGFSYNYFTKITWGEFEYEGCAEKIPYFAEGDDFFEYGKSGHFNEYVEKTGLDEKIDSNSNMMYEVVGIYKNFISIYINELDENGEYNGLYNLVIEKTPTGWEKTWQGQDIDYDSCKAVQAKDYGIWYWSIFRNCSEWMPRG